MADQTKENPGRRWWRIALLSFVVLPFVPEIVVLAVAAIANAAGCEAGSKVACELGSVSASGIIGSAVEAGTTIGGAFGGGVAVAWLAVCCLFITLGWTRLVSRLLLSLAVSMLFALLPYLAPALSLIPSTSESCTPNEGGVGPCVVYGGDIGDVAHDTVILPWFILQGAPMALGTFVVYAIVAVILRIMAGRRATAAQ